VADLVCAAGPLLESLSSLAMAELTIPQSLELAIQHHQGGQLRQAETIYLKILAQDPQCADALHLLGVIAHQSGQHERALELIHQAVARAPTNPAIHSNLGETYRSLGRLDEAVERFRHALALQSNFPDALNNLGNALAAQGRRDEAVTHYRRALALQPTSIQVYNNLGVALTELGRFEEALASFRQALALRPDHAEAHDNLGSLLSQIGRLDEAFTCFQRALALKPDFAEAHNNLGNLLKERGQLDEALHCFRRALALRPDLAEAHNNLGDLFRLRDQFDDALACLQRALALKPDFAEAHNNLGSLFKELGQLDEAIACYRRALAHKPNRPDIHSNLILTLHYRFGHDTGDLGTELDRWNRRHAPPLYKFIRPHANERSPERRLRIGYVSPDFRDHAVGLNLLPLFERHTHDQFEIFCYAHAVTADRVTANFRACSDHWRDTVPLTDAQVADLVRQDQIDILVDLALHTSKNRLTVFARKPAPIQVSFAGYPGATGMDAIDYHLTDPYLDPAAPDDAYGPGPDAPFRLRDTFWCYQPQTTEPAVNPLPALADARLTFGCLNNFCKVNESVLNLWARVLLAVPESRMLLLAAEGSHRQNTLQLLAHAGVSPNRIEFVGHRPRRDYLALYHRIDIGLDTFPYNGHTTSLDSYWMGVPVITLVGQASVGRAGWSQLSNLGLTELAARHPDEFVAIAATLAGDLARLCAMRASLRERMQRSPLMDAPGFAHAIETAYRAMWRRWCTRTSAS